MANIFSAAGLTRCALIEEGCHTASQNLDAQYFHGDFLVGEDENQHTRAVLRRALSSPAAPERPLRDSNPRLDMQRRRNSIGDKP